LANSQRLA